MRCCVLRKTLRKIGADTQETEIAMTQLYLYNAVDIVSIKAKESIISFAEGDEQRMMLMGLKRWTKYANMPNIVALRKQISADLERKR